MKNFLTGKWGTQLRKRLIHEMFQLHRHTRTSKCSIGRLDTNSWGGFSVWHGYGEWVMGENGTTLPGGGCKIAVYIIDWVCRSDLLFRFVFPHIFLSLFFFCSFCLKHNPVICNSHFKLHGRNVTNLNVSIVKWGKYIYEKLKRWKMNFKHKIYVKLVKKYFISKMSLSATYNYN